MNEADVKQVDSTKVPLIDGFDYFNPVTFEKLMSLRNLITYVTLVCARQDFSDLVFINPREHVQIDPVPAVMTTYILID